MPLETKTFDQFVQDLATSWAAALNLTPSLKPGDPALAIFESATTQLQVIQSGLELVAAFARLSTSSGPDVDSFVEQFGFSRLGAQKATGIVVFGMRTGAPSRIVVPVGTVVETGAGDIQYVVVKDTSLFNWSEVDNAYVLPPGVPSMGAAVEAVEAGAASNVAARQLTKFTSSTAGPDEVANVDPITNGLDSESDDDCRSRFVEWVNSRHLGTPGAMRAAVRGLRAGTKCVVIENQDHNGNQRLGFALVVVDDGSGSPPQSLLDQATVVIDAVRPASIETRVIGPTVVDVEINLNVKVNNVDYLEADVTAAVQDAVVAYVDELEIGDTLYLSRLYEVALDAHEGVIAVEPNSVTVDEVEEDKEVLVTEVIQTVHEDVIVGVY